jgi:release factor glutamine methyltransferase
VAFFVVLEEKMLLLRMERLILMKISKIHRSDIVTRLRDSGSVFAGEESELLISTSRTLDELKHMVDRRVAGLPLEYILGWTEFYGLRIVIESGVFVPRRRTEFLVQQAIAVARPRKNIVVDLCCGSGAIGLAMVTSLGQVELYAVDIESSAVRCASHNVADKGRVFQGDLYEPLPLELQGHVDILVANVPYVPTHEIAMMPQEARLYEPIVALDGGNDGLDVQRRVVAEAPLWLAPGGSLIIETSQRQSVKTAELYSNQGLIPLVISSDDMDATVVIGTKPTL